MGQVMGVAQRTYASYERNERTPDADALLPLVEEGWNANWLLTGEGPERLEALPDGAFGAAEARAEWPSHPQRPDPARLRSAFRLLELGLNLADREISADRRAEVLIDLYGWLADHGDTLTPDNLVDFNRYMSAKLKTGSSNG